jgi:hypothetical protein
MMRIVAPATAAAALLAAATSANPATAATMLQFNAPSTQSVMFHGFTDKGNALDGLAARLDLTLVAIADGKAQFDWTLTNLSGGAVDAARISLFGMDVGGFVAANAMGDFARVGSGHVPMLGFADVCFAAGRGGACAGGAGAGIWGGETATGRFTLGFAGGAPLILDNLFVRYQSIDSKVHGIASGSGIGIGIAGQPSGGGVVPEPATWAMLIAGFGLVGASLRRRRGTIAHTTA